VVISIVQASIGITFRAPVLNKWCKGCDVPSVNGSTISSLSSHQYSGTAGLPTGRVSDLYKLLLLLLRVSDLYILLLLLLTLLLLLLHPCNGLISRTIWVSLHQKGKPFWILLEQEMMGWQWHQLDNMQIICTLLQTDNHASTSPLSFYRPDALPAAQPTMPKH